MPVKTVERANVAGQCWGVKRTMEMILSKKEKMNLLGTPIHNPEAVKQLETAGHKVIEDVKDATAGSTVVLSAHGAAKSVKKELSRKFNVLDTSCPLVDKVHLSALYRGKHGKTIIILGKSTHRETMGTIQELKDHKIPYVVVHSVDEIRKLTIADYALVQQTTSSLKLAEEIKRYVARERPDIEYVDTICQPTKDHQLAAEELSRRVDVMLVLGGNKSENNENLTLLCRGLTRKGAYQFEFPNQLRPEVHLAGFFAIGVTGGASTPLESIDQLVELIRLHGFRKV